MMMVQREGKHKLHPRPIKHHRDSDDVIRIEARGPILGPPPFPAGVVALGLGLMLALHTPAWLVLLQYDRSDGEKQEGGGDGGCSAAGGGGGSNHGNGENGSNHHCVVPSTEQGMVWSLLDSLSFLVLDVTPKVASTCLSLFLAGLFLYLGVSKMMMT
jgi:hypothetical protein